MEKERKLERGIAGLLVVVMMLSMVPLAAVPAWAAPAELFFSEYIEGSSYSKALEVYNGTGGAIDLAAGLYSIEIYFNGSTSAGTTIALTGTIADGDVFVVADDGSDPAILAETDQTSTGNFFNGDDAVALLKNGVIVDVIGQIGVDPGSYWGSGDVTTVDHTLRRKESIEAGDIDGSDAFDPTIEWDGYAINTFDGLGSHSIGGGPDYTPIYDIQYTADPGGDSPYAGQVVTTQGIVTGVLYNGYWVEDAAGGPWNGLWVYDSSAPSSGDLVQLTGEVVEYNGLTELTNLTEYAVVSSGNALPDPLVVTTGAANDEQYESVLLRVENVHVTAEEDAYQEWVVDDGSGPLVVDNLGTDTYVPVVGEELAAIIGPLNYNYGAFKIVPRDDSDIIMPGSDYTHIYDIQYTTDPSGDSPYAGQVVTTQGIVTGVLYNGYWVEDAAGGPWNGLWVYDSSAPSLGDLVQLTGEVIEYNGLTELTNLTEYAVVSSGNALPDPLVVTTGAANDEQYESVLLRVENVHVTAEEDAYQEWVVDDGSGSLVVDNLGTDTYVPVVGEELAAIIGPLNYNYGAFKIAPRDDNDIVLMLAVPELVINEIIQDPSAVYDSAGEWFELYNPTGGDIDINGWTIADNDYDSHTIDNGGPLVVPAGGYLVLGNNTDQATNGGAPVAYSYGSGWYLSNGADEVVLVDGAGNEIDRVEYDGGVAFPDPTGASMSLQDPALDNNDGANWCTSTTPFGDGDLGTPGAQNTCEPQEGCGDDYTPIYAVQGNSLTSPMVGTQVSVEGIVVGDFQDNASEDNGDLNGFHIQDALGDGDPATSDGIFVYGTSPDVNVGDHVRVRGAVSEHNGLTEISVSQLWVCSTGNGLPAAAELWLPVTAVEDLEAYEGMLVTFPQALTISEYYNFDRYGEIVLTADRQNQPTAVVEPGPDAIALAEEHTLARITLDDGLTIQNPDSVPHPNGDLFGLDNLFRGGDLVANVTGVLDYYYGYKIQPTQGADYTPVNLRTVVPDDVGGNLKVASFNVLNYFTTLDDGVNDICGPLGNQECRGADTEEEFDRQKAKIIAALVAMDADVVGLIEIENHPGDVPTADLVDGLNEELDAGTYDYIATGAIGTDAIRQAFIYKPATVTPVGDYAILDTDADPRFLDDYNRPALAQTFMDNADGGIFTVAVNHLKSKGSDCNAIGDPDTGDGSGNCNLTRTAAAEALVDWLATDPTGSGDADFLVIGDLNSYDKEDPIDAILAGADDALWTGDDYTDLLYSLVGEDAYSYVFDGRVGYLDYALANVGLLGEVTGVTAWHINADEPDLIDYDMSYKSDGQDALYAPDAYRASDHDPVIVGLDVCDEIAPTAEIRLNRDYLWPPNHKYVTVRAHVDADDNFDPNPTVTLLSVTSNEPDNGLGDGDRSDDIVIMNDFTFKLRAERSGGGQDRIYTITYKVTDACGNATYATATVTVLHDRKKVR